MICRLVLSLRKASDPNLIRAWNVDHFSTHTESQTVPRGLDGTHLSPLRFRGNSAGETGSGDGLMVSTVSGTLAGSGWTVDALGVEDEESTKRTRV